MLPPAPACCQSTAPWPIGAGPSTSFPPPAPCRVSEARCSRGALSTPSFCSESSCTSLPLSQLYNGERRTVGCVSAVLELQRVCGHSHPEGWYVPLWHFEWRFHSGRGRRWNFQSAVPAQTLILLQLPLLPALCKYKFITSHLHASTLIECSFDTLFSHRMQKRGVIF